MIYLDNAATTRMAPEVLNAMMPYLTDEYGNAGTLYSIGRSAATAMNKVAALFGCEPEHVIFTSGGSESNNMVFKGLRHRLLQSGKTHIIVSAIEHDSVLRAAESLTKDGFYITYLKPDSDGCISVSRLEKAIQEDTGLVSIMFVNNEMGAVNDIKEIGQLCRARSILFHTDCVQASGQFPLDVDGNCIDFASVSSHKIHGPKGVGALYVREKDILPLVCGGSEQEYGLRGGTENIPGIVGFGTACDIATENIRESMIRISVLKQKFYTQLMGKLRSNGINCQCVHVNGRRVIDSGKVLSLRFDGVDAETLLIMLDTSGVCVSAGSACTSHEKQPSHVITAMGLSSEQARSTIRFSFSKYNTVNEMVSAAQILASCLFSLYGITKECDFDEHEDNLPVS